MKILLVPILLAASLPAFAEVDPKIHKLCIEAKDYSGCVRAMKGETMPTSRVINSQGADIAEGNKCPSGFAYIGGGNCQAVKCSTYHNSLFAKHDSRLGGKSWGCSNFLWKRSVLYFGEATARTSLDSNCPTGEPQIGWNSTCEKPPANYIKPSTKQRTNNSYERKENKINTTYILGDLCLIRPKGCKTADCIERLPSADCR